MTGSEKLDCLVEMTKPSTAGDQVTLVGRGNRIVGELVLDHIRNDDGDHVYRVVIPSTFVCDDISSIIPDENLIVLKEGK